MILYSETFETKNKLERKNRARAVSFLIQAVLRKGSGLKSFKVRYRREVLSFSSTDNFIAIILRESFIHEYIEKYEIINQNHSKSVIFFLKKRFIVNSIFCVYRIVMFHD